MKIVVGGQIDKEEIARLAALQMNDRAEIGGGGALAMAMAMLGSGLCSTISMPGMIKSADFIREEVQKGKKAFGFTAQHKEEVLPVLLQAIMEKEGV